MQVHYRTGTGNFGEFSPHFILQKFGDGIKVVVHVLQWHHLVWRHWVYTRRLIEIFWKCRKQNEPLSTYNSIVTLWYLASHPFLGIPIFSFSQRNAFIIHLSDHRSCHWVYCLCFYGGTNFSSAKMIIQYLYSISLYIYI